MRILVTTVAGFGHLYPLIPLSVAAQRAGHQVWFATAPEMHPVLERFGLAPVAAGISLRTAFTDPELGGSMPSTEPADLMRRAARVFGEILPRSTARDLGPVITDLRPDLVVEEIMNPGAGLAAYAAGVPVLRHDFGRVAGPMQDWLATGLAQVADELGLAVPDPEAVVPMIDICPPSMQNPDVAGGPGLVPMRPEALRVPGEGPSPVRAGERPLVYLTLGTAFGSSSVLQTAIEAIAALDVDLLVAAGPRVDAAELASGRRNVRVEAWVPQAAVLDEASLVVHHGGSGTTLGCAATGTVQVILPQGADQFMNAGSVAALGTARVLAPDAVSADSVRSAVADLLADGSAQTAADALAAEIAAMPSPDSVAARLPDLVAH